MKKKLNVLSIEEKMKIRTLLGINPLMKENKVAWKFGFPASTSSRIVKNREMVEQKFQNNRKVKNN